uniref:MyTH4 domain-containing protein n=1 Tax=Dendroctonus ponderosae TaxID=77166 RepID=A0AAR5QE88_DENPD
MRSLQRAPHSRNMPPSLLEWKSVRQRANCALPLSLPDGTVTSVSSDSWSTCEEAAFLAMSSQGITPEGWTVVMDDAGLVYDGNGLDYVFDFVSELELCPAFPIQKSTLLKTGSRRSFAVEVDHHVPAPVRPQVPPPEPPINITRKVSREVIRPSPPAPVMHPSRQSSRKSSRELQSESRYSPQTSSRVSPVVHPTSSPIRKASHEALSRSSALNDRYFDQEKSRSRSLDNLLGEAEPNPLLELGLSQTSKLNERYHSVEQLAPIKPVVMNHPNYMSKQELDFEYPDIGSIGTSHRGGPRYIKSQYAGKKAPPGSHSSRAYIEKSEFGVRSSAMSDTSEAPSLASHVRRVRVPSQASDVDQFLDELFSPVLDGNLDELSDARSLAASIKGGGDWSDSLEAASAPPAAEAHDYIEGLDEFMDAALGHPAFGEFSALSTTSEVVLRIKGGGLRDRTNSQVREGNSVLDQEVENITTPSTSASNTNVDDYISDLFRPIFINDSIKTLTEKEHLVGSIKGGGSTPSGASSSSFNYPSIPAAMVSPAPLMMPLLSPTQDGFVPVFNVPQGLNGVPQNGTDLASYQQNLQRAFLQSAMAQNIQIQQQLLAQNQALQQLLTQNVTTGDVNGKVTETIQTTVKAQVHQPSQHVRKSSFNSSAVLRKSSSPSVGSSDYKSRKTSSDSNQSLQSRGIPAPPPMPPPIDECDPNETRPFMDPYGRAKTVRIGKWRWPPPKGDTSIENGEDFMHFKMRQKERKVTPNKEQTISVTNGHGSVRTESSMEWDEVDYEPLKENEKLTRTNSKKAFEIGASRPSPGSIGKIKLSSEMKQRLERVTANHSVRSTSSSTKVDKPSRSVSKLEETRKLMLEQQLSGRWGEDSASEKSTPDSHQQNSCDGSKSPTQQSWTSSSWKPGPPPPPIGPSSLPPAPLVPAPPPPVVRPSQPPPPVEPVRSSFKSHRDFLSQRQERDGPPSSFMAQRQDRDTFGVHQNRVQQQNSKRNSFSANWEEQSNMTETHNDSTSWAQEDSDRHDGRTSRDSWELAESTTITSTEPRDVGRMWDREERKFEKSRGPMKESGERPTFRTHQLNKSALEREKKHSVASTSMTDKTDRQEEVQEWPEFMRPIKTPPPSKSPVQSHAPTNEIEEPRIPTTANRVQPLGTSAYVTYNRVSWLLRVRKEYFTPSEPLGPLNALHLIFCQIVADVYGLTPCIRLTPSEKRAGVNMLSGYGVTAENFNSSHRANIKRNAIELARTWPLYFARLFPVSGAAQLSDVELVAVSHWGVHLVQREQSHLQVLKSFSLSEISSCTAPRPTTVSLDGPQGRLSLHTPRAQQLSEMVTKFCSEARKIQAKSQQRSRSPTMERLDVVPSTLVQKSRGETSPTRIISRDESREGARSPSSPLPTTGKYSLMQFAMQNYRQLSDLEHQRFDQSQPKSKNKSKDWTWKQQTDVIKWQGTPLDGPLLRLDDPELTPLAIECFDCILRYCGDQPLTPEMSEVKCVYTVLMHCHKYGQLRDEVYCQLMKQTTSNKSESSESSQRAWRLLSIVAAYFACSDTLLPYLMEHLSSAANDRRRICHGTAAVCVTNLRKTQRCGGRKNVPSVEEVTAVSAGRSARRQIYRLPGGAERVVNTRCSTVVADVIHELCSLIGIAEEQEQQEFSLYCIVQGDAFTMPLAADEYILDVTTELHKAAQPFYLIFCRSVWYHPLKHDASPLYTEVLFNQVAPDYLEGLLLRLGNPNLPPSVVRDMALAAALLHRAADLGHAPSLKEVKFLLPKPVLGLREPRPPQWLALVQTSWGQAAGLSVSRAKHRVLQVLSSWPLFGSSFFAVKRVVGEPDHWQEHILALNRGGVHFLDMNTHETLQHWPFAEVISTRKVRSEDGALFLDMKCGNLLQQRVTRLQTEQAHEISRLVRQYINLEQEHSTRNK